MPYPNYPGKHGKPAISSPQFFLDYLASTGKGPKGRVPESVIVSYQRSVEDRAREIFGLEPTGIPGLTAIGGTDGRIGLLSGFGIGGAATITCLEPAIVAGARRVVSMGTAGAISRELSAGDIVVCNRGIRDEGVSHHYLESSKYAEPSPDLTAAVAGGLDARQISFRSGSTWTTDAPFRETAAEIDAYQSEGVLTVEMEAASVFAVAQYHGARAAAAFVVSDLLGDKSWKPHFQDARVKANLHLLFTAVLGSLGSGAKP